MPIEDLFPVDLDDIIEAHLVIQELKENKFDFNSLDIRYLNKKELNSIFNELNQRIEELNEKYSLSLFKSFEIKELEYILTSIKDYKYEALKEFPDNIALKKYPELSYFKFMKEEERINEILPLSNVEGNNEIYAITYIFDSKLSSIQSEHQEGFNKTNFYFNEIQMKKISKKILNQLNHKCKLNLNKEIGIYIDNNYSEKILKIKNNKQDLIILYKDSNQLSIEINSLEDYFIARKILNTIYEKIKLFFQKIYKSIHKPIN